MNLAELLTTLNIQTQPHQRWLILGPEAEIFGPKLSAKVEEDSQWPYLRATQSQFVLFFLHLRFSRIVLYWHIAARLAYYEDHSNR